MLELVLISKLCTADVLVFILYIENSLGNHFLQGDTLLKKIVLYLLKIRIKLLQSSFRTASQTFYNKPFFFVFFQIFRTVAFRQQHFL